ncbi:MAG: hypothetical protein CL931_17370 [Deltaproteobacteria bacterium]|nr:hypothetical protein [Deltaproteobacteria bacterium]
MKRGDSRLGPVRRGGDASFTKEVTAAGGIVALKIAREGNCPWAALGHVPPGWPHLIPSRRASLIARDVQEKSSLSSKGSDDSDRLIWLDGELRPWADATVHVLSHAVQRGSLVFDYMSVHELAAGNAVGLPAGPAVFRLAQHVERFFHSCALMGLPVEPHGDAIAAAICETIRANPGAKAVKISAYFASVEIDVVPADMHVTVAIAAYDPAADIQARLPVAPPPKPQTVKLWIEKERANRREDIVSPQAKVSANYASPMTAKAQARADGFDEIVLVDEDGHLAEAPTSNLFFVHEGALVTPPDTKVLHGVTRSSVLEIAKAEGIEVHERALPPEALLGASEAFLTGTTAGVWPIESVDRQPLSAGCPGPISQALRDRFKRASNGEEPEFAHWLTPAAG